MSTFRLFSGALQFGSRSSAATASRLVGVGLGLTGAFALRHQRIVRNDAIAGYNPNYAGANAELKPRSIPQGHFGGKLNYQELSVGSFAGLLCGYVAGKLSRLLVFIAVTGMLSLQFLQSRGIVDIHTLPLVRSAARWANDRFGNKEFLLDKPSFKASFLTSFVIAAFYA